MTLIPFSYRSFKQLIGSLEEFKHQDEKYKQIEKKVADNLRESISRYKTASILIFTVVCPSVVKTRNRRAV